MVDIVADAAAPLPTSDLHLQKFEVPMGPFRKPKAGRVVQLRDLTPAQRGDLEKLRAIVMGFAQRMVEMMPKNPADPNSKDTAVLPPEFDRLLGRNDGIVDSLERLAKVVIRLIDKEREYSESAAAICIDVPRMDTPELDRGIAAELDFITERRRAAASL
jgi:hypothetical protein